MIDLKVMNGDIVINDKNKFVTTMDDVAQEVYLTFTCWMGDWFFDPSFGVDYIRLKDGVYTKEQLDFKIKQKLLGIQGVVKIISFNGSLNTINRFYSFQVEYLTTSGIAAKLALET